MVPVFTMVHQPWLPDSLDLTALLDQTASPDLTAALQDLTAVVLTPTKIIQ